MSKTCCVCGDTKNTAENVLFTCQGHGCDVIVHQGCYGIVTPPSGLWFCRKCESQERAARVRCELCPKKEGALKRTDSSGWAHVVCALYIPEATFGNNERMEPIVTSKLPKERFSKPCYICEEKGLETQAVHGACMSCHKSSCRLAFHVTCAQREHLLCEEEDSRDPRSILYCGYCAPHFKKMAKQRYKQTLRKQVPDTPTGSAPSLLSPLSDLSPSSQTTPLLIAPHPYTLTQGEQLPGEPHVVMSGARVKKERLSVSDNAPSKRPSVDLPAPVRKKRRRKVSSSNESTTSETLSHVSDPQLGIRDTGAGSPRQLSVEAVKDSEGVGSGDVMPFSPVTAAQVGLSGDSVGVVRQPSSSTSSEQSLASRSQNAPPRSLQDLLERQWEQTAQFILDKVGKQDNVGSMLAHLHNLQSENRQMQSRIMELASQREFYIAINTKLRQTLAEQDTANRLPNGVREESQLGSPDTVVPSPQVGRHRTGKRNGNKRTRTEDTHPQSNELPAALSKEAQDSFLKAHFPPSTTGLFTGTHHSDPVMYHRGGGRSATVNHTPSDLSHEAHRRSSTKSSKRSYQAKGPEQTETMHEITRVTNSVQAPISAFAPLPREGEQEGGTRVPSRGTGFENVR